MWWIFDRHPRCAVSKLASAFGYQITNIGMSVQIKISLFSISQNSITNKMICEKSPLRHQNFNATISQFVEKCADLLLVVMPPMNHNTYTVNFKHDLDRFAFKKYNSELNKATNFSIQRSIKPKLFCGWFFGKKSDCIFGFTQPLLLCW